MESQPPASAAASSGVVTAAPVAPTPVSVSTDPRSSERGSRAKRRTRPPFRLCFTIPGVSGRSHLAPGEQAVNIIAGKFYAREEEKIRSQLLERLAAEPEAAAQRRDRKVLLESQKYGMYPRPLVPPTVGDRRLYFGTRTSEMVRIQCEIARTSSAVGPSVRTKTSKAAK